MTRELDRLTRQEILMGAGLESVNIHPAWLSHKDSGLYRKLVSLADEPLADYPAVSGEDLVMDFFQPGKKRVLLTVGQHSGKYPKLFQQHPLTFADPPQQLWKFLMRRVSAILQREQGRQILRDKWVPPADPRNEAKFWDFLRHLLTTRTPPARRLEQRMRAIARESELAHRLIDLLVADRPLKAISGISKDMGGSGSGGSVRWVKKNFIPVVRAYVADDPELRALYERIK